MRIIAKLDVKPPFVVKPVHFEGLRRIGSPEDIAFKYYLQGADEIMYIDIVASLYKREILYSYIEETAQKIFVPFGVGGGIKSLDDCSKLFHSGADKVLINTHVLQEEPDLINKAVSIFGAQSVAINIEAKRRSKGWECYSDCGRMKSGRSVLDWAEEIQERGAGEIIIQSVDTDGRKKGFDCDLVKQIVDISKIPVVAASGAGCKEDVLTIAKEIKPSGIAISSILHYDICSINELKKYLNENGVEVNK